MELKIEQLEKDMLEPGFWEQQERVAEVFSVLSPLKELFAAYQKLVQAQEDLAALLNLSEEENDLKLAVEVYGELEKLKPKINKIELNVLLSDPYDQNNAILTLHAGAGGTEAQDWVAMLLRMYTRWTEEKGYQVNIVDLLPGEEAGIKSVTVIVTGPFAYGYLKAEKGVHRLVRISPFDAAGRRHTSFASVDVLPEVKEELEVNIKPEDLKIDTFRSSGAGGQHVNKTESAVRITHLPTNIVVQCQNERSQTANRNAAMKLLRAKLFDLERRKKEAKDTLRWEEQPDIAWGSQIRSYVFHPYNLVKDHRTGVETGNTTAVMDGEIDSFIIAYLKGSVKNNEKNNLKKTVFS
ncbi:MAG TPA: peptide chain release factor 2 [Desulfotomaculum sp.]|nr:peptide chain release factor 2 [Desulfotomaculum sp.]